MRRNPEIKGISSGLLGAHSLIHDEPRFSQWKQALSSMLRCEKTLVFVRVFIVSERSKETKTKLLDKKYPVIFREIQNLGRQYIDGQLGIETLEELARWIDSLDRL